MVDRARSIEGDAELPVPGPVGRLVRLALAGVLLWGAASLLPWAARAPGSAVPTDPFLWALFLLLVVQLPDAVDTACWTEAGERVRVAYLGAVLAAAVGSVLVAEAVWTVPVHVLVVGGTGAYLGAFGLAYLLAGLLGTPGCEWRSYAHLRARVTGGTLDGVPCAGGIDRVDRWERDRFGDPKADPDTL